MNAGIDMSVIALWLGHESIESTHICVEADLAMKDQALELIAPTTLAVAGLSQRLALNVFGRALISERPAMKPR